LLQAFEESVHFTGLWFHVFAMIQTGTYLFLCSYYRTENACA